MKRLKVLLVAGLSGAALSLTALPANAQTAASCGDTGDCDGLSPITTGCYATAGDPGRYNPVEIYDNEGRHIGQIELRYSSACHSVWARVTNYVSDAGNGYVQRDIGGQKGCGISSWSNTMGGYSCFTYMLGDAGVTSYASAQIWDPYDGYWYNGNTSAY